MPPPVYSEIFRVRSDQIGEHGTISVIGVAQLFQEVAAIHSELLGIGRTELGASGLGWVLARLGIAFSMEPPAPSEVRVETWSSGVQHAFAHRELLLLGPGGERLAAGTGAWVVFDLAQRRAVRVPEPVERVPRPDRPRALAEVPRRLPPVTQVDHRRRFEVRRSDLDWNRHVNHVHLVGMVTESVPEPHYATHRLTQVQCAFRGEALHGDEIVAESQSVDGGYLHRLCRGSDGSELLVARTMWAPLKLSGPPGVAGTG